jgi:hypothetical protein
MNYFDKCVFLCGNVPFLFSQELMFFLRKSIYFEFISIYHMAPCVKDKTKIQLQKYYMNLTNEKFKLFSLTEQNMMQVNHGMN